MDEAASQALLQGIKDALSHQLKAALNTLGNVIESCPDSEWQKDHGDAIFSQVVFHTLFYADFYLGKDSLPFKDQLFHAAHSETFADYEEAEDRKPVKLYEKTFCQAYLAHCHSKVDSMLETESLESLTGESGIDFRHCNRMEVYIYGERHIQHHAAQLGLRIQQASGKEMMWVSGH
jgi:hypothetical protein